MTLIHINKGKAYGRQGKASTGLILLKNDYSRPHESIFVWKRRLFLRRVWPTVLTYPEKTSPKTHLFKNALQSEWRSLKTVATRLRVDGRKRKFSSTIMSSTIYFWHDACSVRNAIVFPLFSVFVWTGEKDSITLRAKAYCFWKRWKIISVFKNNRIRVDGTMVKTRRKTVILLSCHNLHRSPIIIQRGQLHSPCHV